jgi:hypothetical protein
MDDEDEDEETAEEHGPADPDDGVIDADAIWAEIEREIAEGRERLGRRLAGVEGDDEG